MVVSISFSTIPIQALYTGLWLAGNEGMDPEISQISGEALLGLAPVLGLDGAEFSFREKGSRF